MRIITYILIISTIIVIIIMEMITVVDNYDGLMILTNNIIPLGAYAPRQGILSTIVSLDQGIANGYPAGMSCIPL